MLLEEAARVIDGGRRNLCPLEPGPWLYPLYYVGLLLPRQLDDDRRCAAKYGPLWAEYVKRVPWRIIPRVY